MGWWCQAPQGLGQEGPFRRQDPGHPGWGPLFPSPLMRAVGVPPPAHCALSCLQGRGAHVCVQWLSVSP